MYMVGEAERGSKLFYGDKQCGICHAVNGSGGRIAPDLSGQRPETPAMGWMVAVLWNHGPGMWRQIRHSQKTLPGLRPQEMADLLAFMYKASNTDAAGDPITGRQLFSEKGCVQCHSVAGIGGTAAPDLANVAISGNAVAWTSAMLNHAASMITPITHSLGQWPQFNGKEMNDLIAYVSQHAPKQASKGEASFGNSERGWTAFRARCSQCHSVQGQGGSIGPALGPEQDIPLSTANFASEMWNHAPAMLGLSKKKGIPAPQLQGSEMADILAFLASLRYFEPGGSPQSGAKVFAERGCATCHGSSAEGTKLGPPLGQYAEPYTVVTFTTKLWEHGPKMIDRAQDMGITWPTLKPTDVGDLVSFLNSPKK
jgi:mono/diheme cytochrome c family protein